ncbi:MAG TPA: AIM24 family protein [Nocardioides sp.]|nr:AIM24 family protein [Nocardioides sp.]
MTLNLQLVGSTTQMAIVNLQPGQVVYSEAGKFLFSSADVSMETRLSQPSSGAAGQPGQQAGLGGMLRGAMDAGRRMMAGESFAFTHFATTGPHGLLAFAGVLPGEMRALEIGPGETWYAEKDAFVAAEASVRFDVEFLANRAGFMGGEGFVLEKFTGIGTLLIAGAGDFIDINPADHGGRLRVDTGCVVAWDQNIRYGVERVGGLSRQGLMTGIFGGEGFSLATLEGDGRVILQSVTIDALAKALQKNMGAGDRKTGAGLGGIFSGSAD